MQDKNKIEELRAMARKKTASDALSNERTVLTGRRIDDTTVTMDAAPVGKTWVRAFDSSREETAVWRKVLQPNVPVVIDRARSGEYYIKSVLYQDAIENWGEFADAALLPPIPSSLSTSVIGGEQMLQGRVRVSETGTLKVNASTFWYRDTAGARKLWSPTALNALTIAPPSAVSGVNQTRWTVVTLNPGATSPTLAQTHGASSAYTTPLLVADIADVAAPAGHYVLTAIKVTTGDTTFAEADFFDAREWFYRGLFATDIPSLDASIVTSGQLALARGGTNADLSATGAGHLVQLTTGAALTVRSDNLAAVAAPTTGDDSADGYSIGSRWYDVTDDREYVCLDATVTAAAWKETTATGGGVSSVGLSLPSIMTVSGSPVTTSGTLTGTLASQSANAVFVAPDGSAGAPTFRALLAADIPNLPASKVTSGQLVLARGGTNADLNATGGTGQVLRQSSAGAAITVSALLAADIPSLAASIVTSGTFDVARIPFGAPTAIGGTTPSTGNFTTLTTPTNTIPTFNFASDPARLGMYSTGITNISFAVDADRVFSLSDTGANFEVDATTTLFVSKSDFSYTATTAKTNTRQDAAIFKHATSGTPAAGFGMNYLFQLHDSANVTRNVARIQLNWINSVFATRQTELSFQVVDFGASRVGFTARANGTSILTSVNGVAAVAPPAWIAPTGTLSRATFATATVTTDELAQRVAQMIIDMRSFGMFS